MAIDASPYANIQAPQISLPNPLDYAQKAMSLSQMGMQQAMMARQYQSQAQVRQAYTDNTDTSGNLNRQGFLSQLGQNPLTAPMAMDYSKQFAENDKAQADAKTSQMQALHQTLSAGLPVLDYALNKVPADQINNAWPQLRQQMSDEGLPVQNLPEQWDQAAVQRSFDIGSQYKESLENQGIQASTAKTQAETANTQAQTAQMPLKGAQIQSEINKNNSEQLKTGATELGQFKDDIVNASGRKTTGSLIQARDRADRVLSLLQPQPGETPQQTTARLNQYIPQVGTEIGTSLASIMQGGVPDEALQKELSPSTLQSQLAGLQQKITGNPTGANQAALLQQYGDIAKKLRDFSADRLGQITQRTRAAYPYANKYFSDQMDQISSPLMAPGTSTTSPGGEKSSSATAGSGARFGAGDLIMYGGKHYRVGADGDSLIPIKGNQ